MGENCNTRYNYDSRAAFLCSLSKILAKGIMSISTLIKKKADSEDNKKQTIKFNFG